MGVLLIVFNLGRVHMDRKNVGLVGYWALSESHGTLEGTVIDDRSHFEVAREVILLRQEQGRATHGIISLRQNVVVDWAIKRQLEDAGCVHKRLVRGLEGSTG